MTFVVGFGHFLSFVNCQSFLVGRCQDGRTCRDEETSHTSRDCCGRLRLFSRRQQRQLLQSRSPLCPLRAPPKTQLSFASIIWPSGPLGAPTLPRLRTIFHTCENPDHPVALIAAAEEPRDHKAWLEAKAGRDMAATCGCTGYRKLELAAAAALHGVKNMRADPDFFLFWGQDSLPVNRPSLPGERN
jgi:hypothetical protein